MKLSVIVFSLALGVAFGAGESILVVSGDRGAADTVAERRAEAMGRKLGRFETMKSRVYKDVRITEINVGGISFTHADGVARLRFGDLSPEQRSYFGIDEDSAAELYRKEREARLAYEKQVEEREAARKKAAEQEAVARRLAVEKAAKDHAARVEKAEAEAFRSIPALPDIKLVESGKFFRRSHTFYRSSYGYPGYYYSSFHPHYRSSRGVYSGRSGGYCSPRSPGFVIRW